MASNAVNVRLAPFESALLDGLVTDMQIQRTLRNPNAATVTRQEVLRFALLLSVHRLSQHYIKRGTLPDYDHLRAVLAAEYDPLRSPPPAPDGEALT